MTRRPASGALPLTTLCFMPPPDLAVVDVETTGFDHDGHDRVVEIAILRTDFYGAEQAVFETLVDPGRDVGPTHIHGVTAEMVQDAPAFEEVAARVLELLEGTCWIAHNARFDAGFLRAELGRAGLRIGEVPYHCTLRSTRAIYPDLPSKRLERVCEALDIELGRAHAALSDARATRELLQLLRRRRPGLISESLEPFRPPRRLERTSVTTVTRDQAREGPPPGAPGLGRLLTRLPTLEVDHEGAQAYASLLDDVLLDRIVSPDELEAVSSVAESYGLTREAAERIHLAYLENLVRYVLLDEVVTGSERKDLERVQRLLGLEDRDLEALVDEVRAGVDATYDDPGEMDPALRDATVCFTGQMTSRLEGERIDRETAQRLAHERGMVVKKRVTKGLDYLVAADPRSQSRKAQAARRHDVPIVAELEFWRKLGVAVE